MRKWTGTRFGLLMAAVGASLLAAGLIFRSAAERQAEGWFWYGITSLLIGLGALFALLEHVHRRQPPQVGRAIERAVDLAKGYAANHPEGSRVRVWEAFKELGKTDLYETAMAADGELVTVCEGRRELYWHRFDVCVSFSEHDRDVAEQVVECIRAVDARLKVYRFDASTALVARPLPEVTRSIYRDQSRFALVILSKDSERSPGCQAELEFIQERRSRGRAEPDYLIPVAVNREAAQIHKQSLGEIRLLGLHELERYLQTLLRHFPVDDDA